MPNTPESSLAAVLENILRDTNATPTLPSPRRTILEAAVDAAQVRLLASESVAATLRTYADNLASVTNTLDNIYRTLETFRGLLSASVGLIDEEEDYSDNSEEGGEGEEGGRLIDLDDTSELDPDELESIGNNLEYMHRETRYGTLPRPTVSPSSVTFTRGQISSIQNILYNLLQDVRTNSNIVFNRNQDFCEMITQIVNAARNPDNILHDPSQAQVRRFNLSDLRSICTELLDANPLELRQEPYSSLLRVILTPPAISMLERGE